MYPIWFNDGFDDTPLFEVETDIAPLEKFPLHQIVIGADSNSPKLAEVFAFFENLAEPNVIFSLEPFMMQLSPNRKTQNRPYNKSPISYDRYKLHLEPSQRILLKLELSI